MIDQQKFTQYSQPNWDGRKSTNKAITVTATIIGTIMFAFFSIDMLLTIYNTGGGGGVVDINSDTRSAHD